MPAARQAFVLVRYQLSYVQPPQELLTTWGRMLVLPPGARIQSAHAFRFASEQEELVQPLQAIHLAPGATPIWLVPPSEPIIVPIVWLPWPLLSPGALG